MTLPDPKPGLVIHYRFLWSHERAGGADEGTKDRPCTIVVATRRDQGSGIVVIVAPITHARPNDPASSIEIPILICRSLGLDGAQHWLRLDELNRFRWPGFDLQPIPGQRGRYHYGMLPQPLFEALRQAILDRQRDKRAQIIGRD